MAISKIPTIRETTAMGINAKASVIVYKQIVGSEALIINATTHIKFIQITNTHLTLDTYVSFSIKRHIEPTEIFIIKQMLLPIGTAVVFEGAELIVEDTTNLADEDQINYKIKLYTVSGTPTVDIIIKS